MNTPETDNETGPQASVSASDLLARAERLGDKEESISSAELLLLRNVAASSSDLVKAKDWEEFRDAVGLEKCSEAHKKAVYAYEQWIADGDDSFYF